MVTGWFSIYWVAPVVAWLVAQLIKVMIAAISGDTKGIKTTFLSSGNMPSSHSSITVALLVVVAALQGLNSVAFGITFVMTSIVIYDALNVRRAVGEQGEVLRELTGSSKRFYAAKGHLPAEVAVGMVVGAAVALGLLQIL
jgi:uncharacterized protein